jgi:cysteinyl-tRNA synthetase
MITIIDAIYALNSAIVTIRGDVAYDANEQEIAYDKSAAEAKLDELQAIQTAKQEAEVAAKESALSKLTALGLTADEVKAILRAA